MKKYFPSILGLIPNAFCLILLLVGGFRASFYFNLYISVGGAILTVVFVLFLANILFRIVEVSGEGVMQRSIFNKKYLRWQDIDRFVLHHVGNETRTFCLESIRLNESIALNTGYKRYREFIEEVKQHLSADKINLDESVEHQGKCIL